MLSNPPLHLGFDTTKMPTGVYLVNILIIFMHSCDSHDLIANKWQSSLLNAISWNMVLLMGRIGFLKHKGNLCKVNSAVVIAVPYSILWYITPCYNGTWLDLKFRITFIWKHVLVTKHHSVTCMNTQCHSYTISMTSCKTAVTPLLMHWSYSSLTLSHWYKFNYMFMYLAYVVNTSEC